MTGCLLAGEGPVLERGTRVLKGKFRERKKGDGSGRQLKVETPVQGGKVGEDPTPAHVFVRI
jgi:hypothetical protein